MSAPFTAPSHKAKAFNCVFCGAYARHHWFDAHQYEGGWGPIKDLQVCHCSHCRAFSVWLAGQMVYPDGGGAPPPNADLPEDIKRDYEEARSILSKSPRGAAALLRLSIQKLCKILDESGENLNADIGSLVQKGLPAKVQQALDAVRVIGNEAVHPGQIDLSDDIETASALFSLTNFIAEKMLSEPKAIETLYGKLPPSKLFQIQKRDGPV